MDTKCNLSIQILMMLKKYFSAILMVVFLLGCDKEITLPLDENQSMLVIDAVVTDEMGPYYVKLTKSVAVSAASIFPEVSNALVIMKDNFGLSDTLKYTSKGLYLTNKIKGAYGTTYFLEVALDGKKYTAQSTMPNKVPFDSLTINKLTFFGESQYNVIPMYTDPMTLGNNYRFIQVINDTIDKNYYLFNDNLNNGKENQRPLNNNDDSLKVKLNDFVSVEMQCISNPTYLYYYSLRQISGAGPGGGTTPANPPSNIIGGALGIFSAHTVQRKQIQIK
jgi:hypothetical protein